MLIYIFNSVHYRFPEMFLKNRGFLAHDLLHTHTPKHRHPFGGVDGSLVVDIADTWQTVPDIYTI